MPEPGPVPPAPPPDAPTARADAHAHAWAAMRFELVDGHPWVVETCSTCGAGRRYRAFERSWDGLPSRG